MTSLAETMLTHKTIIDTNGKPLSAALSELSGHRLKPLEVFANVPDKKIVEFATENAGFSTGDKSPVQFAVQEMSFVVAIYETVRRLEENGSKHHPDLGPLAKKLGLMQYIDNPENTRQFTRNFLDQPMREIAQKCLPEGQSSQPTMYSSKLNKRDFKF